MAAAGTTDLDASTRLCAVLGHPVSHSASPAMQNAGIAALGLNWRYLAFDVDPGHLRAALEGARAMRFIGLNLTVPHKLLAMEMMDALDESASRWGAVNTVRFEGQAADGTWQPLGRLEESGAGGSAPAEIRATGFNTDAEAIVEALAEALGLESLRGKSVLVLGAGGAGRVAALRLAEENPGSLFLVNRTAKRAEQLAGEIRIRRPGVEVTVGYPKRAVDLVLNATSLGLQPGDELPLDERQFPLSRAAAVYDMIYRPAETALLRAARAAGCRAANGLGMLLHQGARALEIWSGRKAPLEPMRRALEAALRD